MRNPVSEIIPDLHVNEETTHYIISEENINVSAEEIVCPEPLKISYEVYYIFCFCTIYFKRYYQQT